MLWTLARITNLIQLTLISESFLLKIISIFQAIFEISFVFLASTVILMTFAFSRIKNNLITSLILSIICLLLFIYHIFSLLNFMQIRPLTILLSIHFFLVINLIPLASNMVPFFIKMTYKEFVKNWTTSVGTDCSTILIFKKF